MTHSRRHILFRTHYWDHDTARQCALLSGCGTVTVLADETRGPLGVDGYATIPVTLNSARGFGLRVDLPRTLWRCGDYALYHARAALPTVSQFWMIEPDVRFAMVDPAPFFDFIDGLSEADFIAVGTRLADAHWDWRRTMSHCHSAVWQCLFPLIRIRATALDSLLQARQQETITRANMAPELWPNDEAFVTTTLAAQQRSLAAFNDFGTFSSEQSFSFWSPLRERWLQRQPPDGLIYHPVLSGQRYFEKQLATAIFPEDLRRLRDHVIALVGDEWDQPTADRYLAAIDARR